VRLAAEHMPDRANLLCLVIAVGVTLLVVGVAT
jgi:hypothetical protein